MSAPGTRRSTYRERRINAMLHEDPAGTSELPAAAIVVKGKQPARKLVFLISIATAIICAFAVFFLLFRHDTSRAVSDAPARQVRKVAPLPAMEKREREPSTIHRFAFRLRKSKYAQAVGSRQLRLLNMNAKQGKCSLEIASASGIRKQTGTMKLNRPLEIAMDDGERTTLLVDEISRNLVSGYLTENQ